MTTIAYRAGVMAGDTALTDRGVYCGQYRKIYRSDDGKLLGVCGCLGTVADLRDWFIAGAEGDPPTFKDEDSEGLLVHPNGRAEWLGPQRKRIDIDGPFHAIGSGFQLAMGALHAGATAARALEIACELDIRTRGPVTILRHVQP